jgi:hypothetical protein
LWQCQGLSSFSPLNCYLSINGNLAEGLDATVFPDDAVLFRQDPVFAKKLRLGPQILKLLIAGS